MQNPTSLISGKQSAILREAERPVIIFGGAIGDHLLMIPAIRALGQLFPGRLEFVCFPRRWHAYYGDVKFANTYEQGLTWDGQDYSIDADGLARQLAGCDLVMSFNSWDHPSVARFLKAGAPANSIGYFPSFKTVVPWDFEKNTTDLNFDLVNYLDPDLTPDNFAYAPAFPASHRLRARQLREDLPGGVKVLAVHTDTKTEKMWVPDYFAGTLDLFLDRHPGYVAVVIGQKDLGLKKGRHADRIFTRFDLPTLTALSFMGEADLFLGVDSCMLHAADLFGTPGVGLFGPTDPQQWGFRFSRHHRDLRGAGDKMENLQPWQALEALEEVEAEIINLNYQQLRSVV